jgi:hypothetical protein
MPRTIPSRRDYKTLLARRTKEGGFFHVWRGDVRRFGLHAAVVLGHLLNYGKARASNGFILCTSAFLRHGLGLCEAQQTAALDVLTGWGVIEVETRGFPPRRHVRINLQRLEDLAHEENE